MTTQAEISVEKCIKWVQSHDGNSLEQLATITHLRRLQKVEADLMIYDESGPSGRPRRNLRRLL